MKKVLITGGFGFIGKHLINKLDSLGIEILILEHPDVLIPENFNSYELIKADLTDQEAIAKLKIKGVDTLIHLAAQSSGPKSFSIPEVDIKLNILGTLNAIKICENNSIDRILYASSFVVYGDVINSNHQAIKENTCCNPKSVYANSKLCSENLLKVYAEPKGIKWNTIRMFNVYGPGQDISKPDQGVVGIFLNMLLKEPNVIVKGSLDRFRDLIYIDDVIEAWTAIIIGTKFNETYNLGTGDKTYYRDLIDTISKTIGYEDYKVQSDSPTPGDILGCYADIKKLKEDFGFEPKYTLQKGLSNMIKSYI